MCTPLFWWLPTVNNRFRAKVYLGDLSSVFRAAYDSMSGDGRAVLAFSTEAPPRSGSANEHEGTLAEAGVFLVLKKNLWGEHEGVEDDMLSRTFANRT